MKYTIRNTRNAVIRLINVNPGHAKFYSFRLRCRKIDCIWGRIGGQWKAHSFTFDDNDEALEFLERKLQQKLRRGYSIDTTPQF